MLQGLPRKDSKDGLAMELFSHKDDINRRVEVVAGTSVVYCPEKSLQIMALRCALLSYSKVAAKCAWF